MTVTEIELSALSLAKAIAGDDEVLSLQMAVRLATGFLVDVHRIADALERAHPPAPSVSGSAETSP